MSYSGIPEAVYQKLEGHEGYLSNSYKRYTEQELAEAYQKGVKSLLVFETAPDLTGINEELKEKDKRIEDLEKKLDSMNQTLLEYVAKRQIAQDKP